MVIIIVLAVVVIGGYLYLHGSGSHTADTSGAQAQAQTWWDTVQHDPRFYTAVGACLIAVVLKMAWGSMGNPARYTLIALVAIAAFASLSGGHA